MQTLTTKVAVPQLITAGSLNSQIASFKESGNSIIYLL